MSRPVTDERSRRTLYVGNLDISVSEDFVCTLFSQFGRIIGCKIIRDPGNDAYAFLEFTNHQAAASAIVAMNKRLFFKKEMKVNWAVPPGNQTKQDAAKYYHIFVGDLCPEIDTRALKDAFAPFGEISNCRIVRDPQTLKSKGYAFITFAKKNEAQNAITAMNGQWLGSRIIRTNWSTRKLLSARNEKFRKTLAKVATYEEVYNQSSPTNCTVYCGTFGNDITDELVHKTFSPFGMIKDIRLFKDKGYAFIKFVSKEFATRAIEAVHNTEINGHIVKCSWSKEISDENNSQTNVEQELQTGPLCRYTYNQPMGYYPQSYQVSSPAPVHCQYVQTYPFGHFGYQPNYICGMGMHLVNAWQGMPLQPHVSAPVQQITAVAPEIALAPAQHPNRYETQLNQQQQNLHFPGAIMMTYSMQ